MNREEARIKILHTLEKSNVSGVAWNGFYLKDILNHQTFIDGKVTTHFLQSVMGGWKGTVKTEPRKIGESEMNNNQTKMISPWMYYGEAKHKIKKAHHRDSTDDIATNSDAVHYSGPLMAEYPGKVLKVNVKQGDQVEKDQVVVVCESMKMEFSYTAPAKTKVKSVKINPGEVIQAGKLMIEWED
jgi:acetyl/propionyl-CoA carboxylase alpha subunit